MSEKACFIEPNGSFFFMPRLLLTSNLLNITNKKRGLLILVIKFRKK